MILLLITRSEATVIILSSWCEYGQLRALVLSASHSCELPRCSGLFQPAADFFHPLFDFSQ